MGYAWSNNEESVDLVYPMSHVRHITRLGQQMWLTAALRFRFPTEQHLGLHAAWIRLEPLPEGLLALEVFFISFRVEEIRFLSESHIFDGLEPPLVWRYGWVVVQRPSVERTINELIWTHSDPLRLLLGIHEMGGVRRL